MIYLSDMEYLKEQAAIRAVKTKLYAYHILTNDMLDDLKHIKDDMTDREKAMGNMMHTLNEPIGKLCEVVECMQSEIEGLRKSFNLVKEELKAYKEDKTEEIEVVWNQIDDPLNFVAAFESCAKSVSLIPDPVKRDFYMTFLSAKFKIKKELVEDKINTYRNSKKK